jgi:hypothetical protein
MPDEAPALAAPSPCDPPIKIGTDTIHPMEGA